MKLKFLFLAILTVTLTACSGDDDAAADTSASLIGAWIGQDVDYSGTTTTTVEGVSIDADFVGETFDVDFTLTFSEDPNEVVSEGSYGITLTTTIAGETTTQDIPNNAFASTGTWSRSGDTITISADGQTSELEITELTDSTLRVVQSIVQDLSDPDLGISIINTTTVEAVFTR